MPIVSPTKPLEATLGPVVFFDGVCGLCNGFIDFLLRTERSGLLRFAPLQGATARRLLGPLGFDLDDLQSVIFLDAHGQITQRSAAVAEVLAHLGRPWQLASAALRSLPTGLRDRAYDAVASQRYRVFGKKASCRLPTPTERLRFLD